MSKPTAKKIGGEYGDVRATIDLQKLNAYLESCVPEIAAPVTVKQFKVCTQALSPLQLVFLLLCSIQFGQVRSGDLLSYSSLIPSAD